MNEPIKCSKYKFHDFCERQGWLLLYDTITEEKSSICYLLQDGNAIVADFDTIGEFKALTDITNCRVAVDRDSNDTKDGEEE